jgi:putative ABC transport system permease protein
MMGKLFETLKLALVTLKANKMRSSLTMLGVIIGVMSVILLVSIGSGLKTYITSQLEGLGSNLLMVMPGEFDVNSSSGSMQGAGMMASKLTVDQAQELRQGSAIKAVMAYTENNATITYKGKSRITQAAGVSYEYPEIRNQYPIYGSFFTASQEAAAKKIVALGYTVADKLFGQEDPTGKKVTISDNKFTVIGVLEKKGALGGSDMDNQIFIPVTTALSTFEMENVLAFWVQAKDKDQVELAKKQTEEILLKTLKDDEFSVVDTKSLLSMVSQILGTLTLALAGIAAISLIVGGIGIMNIMLVSVTERTKEIGLRKAIGATRKIIMTQFLIESTVLSAGGGIIGILLGTGFSMIINQFFPATVTAWSVLLAFFVSVIIGITFGVLPAARAARLNPIQALRYE